MKKSTLYTLFLVMFSLSALAQNQVRVTVNIVPPYSTNLADYYSSTRGTNKMIVTVQNMTNVRQEFYARVDIMGVSGQAQGVRIYTKPNVTPSHSVVLAPREVRQLFADEIRNIYHVSDLIFENTSQQQIKTMNRVPEGEYTFCLRIYDKTSGREHIALSPEKPLGCTTIFMRNVEAPILIQPHIDAETKSFDPQNVIFSWNQPVGTSPGTLYRLKIIEILESQGQKLDPNMVYEASRSPIFDREIMGNVFIYGPAEHALVKGRRYAWAVTAIDPTGQTSYQNNGRSEVRAFTYKDNSPNEALANIKNVVAKSSPISDVANCECKVSVPQSAKVALQADADVKVNHFIMKVLSIDNASGNKYSGIGTIPLPIVNSSTARLRVRFIDMEVVNSGGTLTMAAGVVKGIANGQHSFIPKADNPSLIPAPLSSSEINSLGQYFENQKSQLVSNLKNSSNSLGFELPIGLDKGPITIGITQVLFTPTQSWFNAVASMDIPDGNAKAAFEMTNACMNASDMCGQFKLRLKEDLPVPSIGMKLVQGNLQGEGTYIVFDKEGFKELSLAADYTFQGGLKQSANNQNLTARMNAKTTKGWSDWVAEVAMPDFYVDGLQSVTFSMGNRKLSYDHSDLQNPAGMPSSITVASETYSAIASKTWHGFFIPEITVNLPAIIKKGNAETISFTGKNIIIDGAGLTGAIQNTGTPIVSIGEGSMDGWYASVDHFTLNFFKSGFRESKMTGKLVLPATKNHTNLKNQLDYSSTLSTGGGTGIKYSFNVKPKNDLEFDALFATVTIKDNSHISIEAGAGQSFSAKTALHGEMSINSVKMPISGLGAIDMPGVKFENVKFQTTAPFWDKEGFSMEFASPQKKLAGFNFSLAQPELDIKATSQASASIGLIFGGELALLEENFTCKASTSFSLASEIKKQDNRIVWGGIGGKINDISFAAGTTIGPLTLNGAIMYYNKPNDEGFVGAIQSGVSGMFDILVRAQFGTTSDSQGKFKYFDFNALVDLGQTGITFAPPIPLAMFGFGGGFFYNKKLDNLDILKSPANKDKVSKAANQSKPANASGAESLLNYNPAGLKLSPARGYFGLSATVLLGLTSRNTLDADATLSMGFTTSGGIEFIQFNGNARILTDVSKIINERNNFSTGLGTVEIKYDFENKILDGRFTANMGVPLHSQPTIIGATAFAWIHKDPTDWWFYAGTPSNPNEATIFNFAEATSYFMIGSKIEPMPDIPQEVMDIVRGNGDNKAQEAKLRKPNEAQNRGKYSASSKASGLVVGAHTGFHMKGSFLMFFGEIWAKTGFDLALINGVQCGGITNPGGPGGWYAMGQAYLGAKAKVGVEVDLLLIKGKYTIFDAGAAAVIRAGLPNPTWVDGYIGAYFRILDGLVKGNFNFHVSVGDQCRVPGDAFGGLELISEVLPPKGGEPLEIDTEPSVLFSLPVGKSFILDDFTNVDKNGNPMQRHFLFDTNCYDVTLNGNNVKSNLQTSTNPDAASYLWTYKSNQYLNKNSDYKFEVKAYLKEKKVVRMSGQTIQETPYRFVDKNGNGVDTKNKAHFQLKSTEFRTNDGFKTIKEENYDSTYPTHGHKSLAYAENGDQYLRFIRDIRPEDYQGVSPQATLWLRVFKNGQKHGADKPISSRRNVFQTWNNGKAGSKELFELMAGKLPTLDKNADYICLIIAKNPANSGGATIKREDVSGTLLGNTAILTQSPVAAGMFKDVTISKISSSVNRLTSGEKIIGGYQFKTSNYAKLRPKANDIRAYSIKFDKSKADQTTGLGSNSTAFKFSPANRSAYIDRTITNATDKQTAIKILDSWLPKDPSGNYVIISGSNINFPITVNYSGERWSTDYTKTQDRTSSNPLFSEVGESGKVSFPWMDKAMAFISEKTGVPLSKFKHETGFLKPDYGPECKTSSNAESEVVNLTSVGGPHPVSLPQQGGTAAPSAGSSTSGTAPSSGVTGSALITSASAGILSEMSFAQNPHLSFIANSKIGYFKNGGLTKVCREYENINISDPIQMLINKVINSRINPQDAYATGAGSQVKNQAGNSAMNQGTIWQSVNQSVNGFRNKQIDNNQLGQQVNGAIMR